MMRTHNSSRGDCGRRLARPLRGLAVSSLVLAVWFAPVANANTGVSDEPADRSIFAFDGFGALGVVHSSEDNAEFTGSGLTPTGAGFGHSWSAGNR
jgi:hypothetical protein